jgi:hypothetical protein
MPINTFGCYTSYFSVVMRHPRVRKGELEPISIATSQPNGFNLYSDNFLKPFEPLVISLKTGRMTEEIYRYQYRLMLEKNFEDIDRIKCFYENTVLVCWEKTGSFCHRRIFADWYLEKTGFEIPELTFGEQQETLQL